MIKFNKNNYKNIILDLEELSNIDLQRKLWLNINNDTGNISSYTELYNRLFDDDSIELFYKNIQNKDTTSKEIIEELGTLINMLNSYKEPSEYWGKEDDSVILKDSNWHAIIKQANIVLELLKTYKYIL